MQIREQGRQIQCIRSVYDPAIKRSRQTVVATLPRYGARASSPDLPDLLKDLTDEEKEQVIAWLTERTEREEKERLSFVLKDSPRMLKRVVTALSNDHAITEKDAFAIWQQMHALGKALKKRGFEKPSVADMKLKAEH